MMIAVISSPNWNELKGRGRISEHRLADNGNRRESLAHEVVVEFTQREAVPLLPLHVGTELQNFQFAEGVVKICRVGGAALDLYDRAFARLVTFLDEEV